MCDRTQYLYSAQGQRARKDVGTSGTVFHYDRAGHLIAETGTGTNLLIKREYVWLEDIPLAFGKIAQRPEEIRDNPDATVTGAWTATTQRPGFYGADYLNHAPVGEPAGTLFQDDLDAVLDDLAQAQASFTGPWVAYDPDTRRLLRYRLLPQREGQRRRPLHLESGDNAGALPRLCAVGV